jgi:PAS domain S-box-containing protein
MGKSGKSKTRLRVLRNYFWGLLALWTLLVGSALLWSLLRQRHEITEVAYFQVRSAFEKDVVYRQWAAKHGGVYVPVTGQTPPSPYLSHIEERDIETPSGRKLTLMNPSYMTRQMHEMGAVSYGLQGHITSLDPIRPANAADQWEAKALRAFEQGAKEVSSIEKIGEREYMRLMRPMIVEQDCLKCHAEQGYKVGDLRGGISVSVPMAPIQAIAKGYILTLAAGHFLLWLLGLGGISLGGHRLKLRVMERYIDEQEQESLAKFPSEDPNPVLRITEDGEILYSNEAGKLLLGQWKSKVGQTVPEKWVGLIAEAFVSRKVVEEVEVEVEDRVFSIAIAPVEEAGYANLYGRDITERKLAEEELFRYASIVSCSSDMMAVLDTNFVYLAANKAYLDAFDMTKDQIVGRTVSQVFGEEVFETSIRSKASHCLEGNAISYDEWFQFPVYGSRFMSVSYSPFIGSDGDLRGFVVNGRDMTEHKLIEEQIKNMAKFPSENPNPVLRVTKDGQVLYSNQAGKLLLGQWKSKVGEIVPEKWNNLIAEAFASGKGVVQEEEVKDRVFLITVAPVKEADYINLYGRDITERKKAENQLHKVNEQLDTRVKERTEELAMTVDVLQGEVAKRMRLEKEVLEISEEEQRRIGRELHDGIQQELVGMTFECQLLNKKLKAKSLPEADAAAKIHRLLGDAIEHTRAVTKMLYPVDLDSKDMAFALEQLALRVENLFHISCKFTHEKSLAVKRPEVAINIYRIVQEAVTNAVKHGKADSILINLDSSENRIIFTIRDNGSGLAADYDNTQGMGLRIMKYRASMIGASLNIEAGTDGDGTLVTCSFESTEDKL